MLFHAINPNCTQKHVITQIICNIISYGRAMHDMHSHESVWSMLDCIGAAEECHVAGINGSQLWQKINSLLYSKNGKMCA